MRKPSTRAPHRALPREPEPAIDENELARAWVEGELPYASIRVTGRNELPLAVRA